MKKALLVIDMQNDFITGALGTAEAVKIVPAVDAEICSRIAEGYDVAFTRDTHSEDYLDTQEGRFLPVVHCVRGTKGWQICDEISVLTKGWKIFDKPSFGSLELAGHVAQNNYQEVELIGLCTDICVISNAMCIKAAAPETLIQVKATCCAGVTPQSHNNALEAMKMCQVQII